MRRHVLWILLTGAAACVGCQGRPGYRFLHLIGLVEKPLVMGFVIDANATPAPGSKPLNPFAPYKGLRAALGASIGRRVIPDLYFPFQVEPNLELGICHVAVLSPWQYARLQHRERFAVLAADVDTRGRASRAALLLTPAESEVRTVEQLRGRKVAFGPAADARTYQAGLILLEEHGVKRGDLALELLPVPGSVRNMPNMKAVLSDVRSGGCVAGFVDSAVWEALPEHAADSDEAARDQFRVLAETMRVPDRLLVASPRLDAALVERMRACLLALDEHNSQVLRPMGISGFKAADRLTLEACARLANPEDAAGGEER